MKANRITRINALVQRIVTSAGIEASKFANEGFTFDLRPRTAYVINRHAARLPMKTSGSTLFHGRPATWYLTPSLGCISIVAD
jgi:hypothetical protein